MESVYSAVRAGYLNHIKLWSRKSVIPVACVKIGNGVKIGNCVQSNRTVPLKVYLMAILDNYMLRPLLAIFRLSGPLVL